MRIDFWQSPVLRTMNTIRNPKNTRTATLRRNICKKLSTGSGHFDHVNSPVLSYFSPSSSLHLLHSTPSYPVAHLTGLFASDTKPPKHANSPMHLITLDEKVFLQNPWLTMTLLPPVQTEFGGQGSQKVEFHVPEYVFG